MGLFKTNREGYKLTYSTDKRVNSVIQEIRKIDNKIKRQRVTKQNPVAGQYAIN